MLAARRSVPALVSVAVALAWLPFARAQAPAEATPSVAPPVPPAAAATPPVVVEPLPPRLRTIHRQVSLPPLVRDYRSLPLGNRADVAAREKIDAALVRVPAEDLAFDEAPLRDFAQHFRETLDLPLAVDTRALEDAGLDLDTPVTFESQGETGRAVLARVLSPLDLVWIVRDETLLITTKEKAEENLEVRLYPLPWGYQLGPAIHFLPLIDLIQSTVAADTWDTVGGPGAIRPLEAGVIGQLVVSTTNEVHEEIEGFLGRLHEQALAEWVRLDDPAGKVPRVRVHHVADEKVREDLARKLVELCNTSLPQGADPDARVTPVGECLAVQSRSPEFHALAGQLIQAVAGETVADSWSGSGAATEASARSGGFPVR
jgi:hypothetical protein